MTLRLQAQAVLIGLVLLACLGGGPASAQLACGPFTAIRLDPPAPRVDVFAAASFDRINHAVRIQPHRVLFLGDSITERWDMPVWDAKPVWDANLAPRGVLNAGVSGDRTEHLLWRLDHGNLDGPAPKGVIVLIGTNDLGHGRPPELAAEGIRAVLLKLRWRLPEARVLLLGLWPRGASETDPLRREVGIVNQLIRRCADNRAIVYADIGGVLLDERGDLSRRISPDLLHFTGAGYARLAPPLDKLIDALVGPP